MLKASWSARSAFEQRIQRKLREITEEAYKGNAKKPKKAPYAAPDAALEGATLLSERQRAVVGGLVETHSLQGAVTLLSREELEESKLTVQLEDDQGFSWRDALW